MTINEILFFTLASCGLFAIGLYIEKWTRPKDEQDPDLDDVVDDEDLFVGWDWLTARERRKRLSLYRRRVSIRNFRQELAIAVFLLGWRAWS